MAEPSGLARPRVGSGLGPRETILLVVFGWACLASIVAVALACLAMMGWVLFGASTLHVASLAWKVLVPASILLLSLVWGLRIQIQPPQGRRLSPRQVPALFEVIEDYREELGGPVIHEVWVTEAAELRLVRIPLLGAFGWSKNVLLVGLPVLVAMPGVELEALIASELSRYGKRFSVMGFVHMQIDSWAWVSERLARDEAEAGWLQLPFFASFVKYLLSQTHRLAETRQAMSDRRALEVIQPPALVSAIVRMCAIQWYLKGHFWPEVWRGMGRAIRPPGEVYALMTIALQAELPAMHAAWSYQKALTWESRRRVWGRPTAKGRLRGIGAGPVSRLPRPEDAGAFLGDAFSPILEDFSLGWMDSIGETWESLRVAVTAAASDLADLEADSEQRSQHRLRRAHLTEIVHGEEAAVALYRAIVRDEPANAKALFALGKARLHMGESRGVECIRRAVEIDSSLRQDAEGLVALHDQFMDLSVNGQDAKRPVARVGLRHRSSLH